MGPIEGIFRELKERIVKYGWTPYASNNGSREGCGCILNHLGYCHGYGNVGVGDRACRRLMYAVDASDKYEIGHWNDQQPSVEPVLAVVDRLIVSAAADGV